MKAIITLAIRYPEPTKENTTQPVAHILLDIWEDFRKHNRQCRDDLFDAAFRLLTDECQHDIQYRTRFLWFINEIQKRIEDGTWPEVETPPAQHWKK